MKNTMIWFACLASIGCGTRETELDAGTDRGAEDAGAREDAARDDAGADDAAILAHDAGSIAVDAGPPQLDAGPTAIDAGAPRVDAGPPRVDAGSTTARSPGCGLAATGNDAFVARSITVRDRARTYYLRVPPGYDPQRAYPIVSRLRRD